MQKPQDPAEFLQSAAVQVAEHLASRHFQWPRLRSFQRRAVEAWAAQRPSFVLSGTGSGKSGCFVLPALVDRHWLQGCQGMRPVSLVISPLVALMHDQAQRLRSRGLGAVVCSPQGGASWDEAVQALKGGAVVLFMSPERAVREAQRKSFHELKVSLLAIDEAHCVSEWGHDFRAEYDQLSLVIAALAGTGRAGRCPPVLALTATCRSEVRGDVMRSLGILGAEQIIGSMNRPNLHYSVEEFGDEEAMLRRLEELFAVEGRAEARRARPIESKMVSPYSPSIIYCTRKRDAERVAKQLAAGGVLVEAFHAEKSPEERAGIQDAFTKNQLQAVAATVAFGMGIDKPDVRRVLHYFMPNSLEAYMQESGRAGRDGRPGCCMLLFTKADRRTREQVLLHQEISPALRRNLARCQAAYFYCCNRHVCRRAQLLQYLGEEPLSHFAYGHLCSSQPPPVVGTPGFCFHQETEGLPRCGRCDTCDLASSCAVALEDVSQEMALLLKELAGGRRGRCALVQALRKRQPRTSNEDWQRILDLAIHEDFIYLDISPGREGRMAFASPQLTKKGHHWLTAPDALRADMGKLRRVPSVVPETLESVPEPTVADDGSEDELPLLQVSQVAEEVCEEDLPLACFQPRAHGEAKRKGDLLAQATPQRRRCGDRATKLEVMDEVLKLRELLEESDLPEGRLTSSLLELRKLRAALQASALPASCDVPSPDAISVQSEHRARMEPKKAKALKPEERPKATRAKAAMKYSSREREESSELIQMLMDAADVNSNQQGGSQKFKAMMQEAKRLAPPEKRTVLEEVVQKHFLAKTPGRHRERLRQVILQWKAEGL